MIAESVTGPTSPFPSARRAPRLPRWLARHTAAVIAVDVASVVAATAVYGLWGTASIGVLVTGGAVVLALTAAALLLARAWTPAVLGQGTTEFACLLNGMAGAAVVIGLASLALDYPQGRPWVFAVLPVATVLALAGRKGLRTVLVRRRKAGHALRTVLAVGSVEAVTGLVERTRRARHEGLEVTAVCVPGGAVASPRVAGVPVVGDVTDAQAVVFDGGFDIVSVGRVPGWTPADLRALAWSLEHTDVELLVDPGLMEIAGPRLHTATVDGMPLLQLTHPRLAGLPRMVKACFDRVGAVALLVLLSPLLLAVGAAVARDGGPVLFRQTRVGADGRTFRMVKFRSMVVDAETRLAALATANEGSGPLFKMRDDPRITRIGAILRRYSLDELPQLFNVVAGSMSLVRLDLRYVENWTFALDLQILVRTVRAIRGGGAY